MEKRNDNESKIPIVKSLEDVCRDTPLVRLGELLRNSGKKSIKELMVGRNIIINTINAG